MALGAGAAHSGAVVERRAEVLRQVRGHAAQGYERLRTLARGLLGAAFGAEYVGEGETASPRGFLGSARQRLDFRVTGGNLGGIQLMEREQRLGLQPSPLNDMDSELSTELLKAARRRQRRRRVASP